MPLRRLVKSASNGRLLGSARSFLNQYPESLAIVPGRLAGELLSAGGVGIAGVRRSTLPQLAAALARPSLAERGLAPLGSLGLEALAARVAHEARQDGALKYFHPVAGMPGFAAALAKTLSELRLAGTRADELRAAQPARGLACADLAVLLAAYERELSAGSLADLAMIFEFAGDPAEKMGLPLLLLDAPLDSRAHRTFFARLVSGSPAVLAAVTSTDGLTEILGAAEDLDTDTPSTSIEHLRRFLFSQAPPACANQEGFEMFSAPGEGLETTEIARRILALAGSMTGPGIAFDQMAILLRSPERYQSVTEDALRRAGIPAYFSRGTARPDPAGRAFLALLRCAAEDCSASSFAEYLSLGQVPEGQVPELEGAPKWVAAADEVLTASGTEPEPAAEPGPERVVNAPGGWERLLVDAAVIGGPPRWARRLRGLEREFELRLESLADDDEAQRNHVSRQLERLRNLADFALPLIETLDELPDEALWSEWLDALAGLARKALRSPEGVLAVLAEFEPMGAVGPVTVEEVAHVLSERLRFLRPEPPARRWGRVFVGSIEEARGCEFRVVFLPGLAEGLFPRRALEDPLLLDEVRKELSRDLPMRADRNHEERQKLRWAVAAARERLIASYPRMDAGEARARVPSFYALELPRALQGALPQLKEFEAATLAAASARLNWPAPREAAQAIDDTEYDLVALLPEAGRTKRARYLVETNRHLARSLRARYSRWRPSWSAADGLITQNADALAALGSQRLGMRAWSPSALEQFATCPYKFALNGIHRLRPREDAAPLEELDPLTRGALFHEVQFALLMELKAKGLLPLSAAHLDVAIEGADSGAGPERPSSVRETGAGAAATGSVASLLDETLDRIAAKYAEDLAPAVPRVWKTGIEDLRTDLRGWLQQAAQNDDNWLPAHFEFSFGMEPREGHDPESVRDEAVLGGVRLRGSIDLVEKHMRTGVLRVTDHKTGKPPERIPAYTGGGRVLQPLLYALAAERLFGANVESGRLFYATQRGGYQQIGVTVNASARRFMDKLLSDIDDAIASGFLPPVPEKDACGICDYRAVCGPYEEHRASRYKNRQDERLDGLHEIRGFL